MMASPTDPVVLTGSAMSELLRQVHGASGKHCIGQTRELAEHALSAGRLSEGWTVTFYDYPDSDAYCLARVAGGKLVVEAKTFGLLDGGNDKP